MGSVRKTRFYVWAGVRASRRPSFDTCSSGERVSIPIYTFFGAMHSCAIVRAASSVVVLFVFLLVTRSMLSRGRPVVHSEDKASDGLRVNVYVSRGKQEKLRELLVRLHADTTVPFTFGAGLEGEKLLRRGLLDVVGKILDGTLVVKAGEQDLPPLELSERLVSLEVENKQLSKSVEVAEARVGDQPKRGPRPTSSNELLLQLRAKQKAYDQGGAGSRRPKSTILAERSKELVNHLTMLGVYLCGGSASAKDEVRKALKAQFTHLCSGPLSIFSVDDLMDVANDSDKEAYRNICTQNVQNRHVVQVEDLIEFVDTCGLSQRALAKLYRLVGIILPPKKSYLAQLAEYALLEQAAMCRERCDTGERINLDRLFELLQILYPWTAVNKVDPLPLFHFDATNCLRSKLSACTMEFVNDQQAENGVERASWKHNWVFCLYFESDSFVHLRRNLGGWGGYFDSFLERLREKNVFFLLGFDGAGAHEATGIGDNASCTDFHLYRSVKLFLTLSFQKNAVK